MRMQTIDASKPETLRFGHGDTAHGAILLAESMRGIAALLIGDDCTELLRALKDAFPGYGLVPDQAGLAQSIAKAAALVEAPHGGTDLTLDLCGSTVEVAVWSALEAIPAGETPRACRYRRQLRRLAQPARPTALRCRALPPRRDVRPLDRRLSLGCTA